MPNDGTTLNLANSLEDDVHDRNSYHNESSSDPFASPESANIARLTSQIYSQSLLSSTSAIHSYNLESDLSSNSPPESKTPGNSYPKPPVGSDEWHRVRRENHKEVERRRRETINSGINELAKIVPGCEKNKGSILSRTVQYIHQLKESEATNIEKWTLEKLLTDQAINELSAQVEMLKADNQQLHSHMEELNSNQKRPRIE
ncbi:basic helix-loop-helix protein [Basidiobolus ranarum]|uniref:Basic helix-loop-helix protein n=1 Tax=Basidiobolus ranarum TaxID=34480 RepID=A0ABR2WZ39_9FUNG